MTTYSWVKYMYVCNTMQYCMYGNGGKTLCIFNLCVKYVCVIGFNPQPLYLWGNDLPRRKVCLGGCSGKKQLTVVLLAQRPWLCNPYGVTTLWGITSLIIKLNSVKNHKIYHEGQTLCFQYLNKKAVWSFSKYGNCVITVFWKFFCLF